MASFAGRFYHLTPEVEWRHLAQVSSYNARLLACLCQISPRQLRRYFQKRFGRSPQDWLNEQRMISAGKLLADAQSVKEVAFTLGFKQVSHFSREFKHFYGLPASKFAEAQFREHSDALAGRAR